MKMVSVTRMLSTLCLNKQHADCPGGLDSIECQCACHKQQLPMPPHNATCSIDKACAHIRTAPHDPDLDDMGFA